MKSTSEVFNGFMQGLASGTDSWKQFVAEDIVFKGPIDKVEGIDAFAQLNANFFPMVQNHQIHRMLESGNTLVTNVGMEVKFPSETTVSFSMAEFYDIEDEKIKQIEVFYDAEEFRQAMAN